MVGNRVNCRPLRIPRSGFCVSSSPRLDRKTTVVGVIKNLAGQTAASPDPMHRIGRARSTTTTNNDFPWRGRKRRRRRWFAIKLEYCRDTVQQLELVEYPGCDLPKTGTNFCYFFLSLFSFLFFFLFPFLLPFFFFFFCSIFKVQNYVYREMYIGRK